MNIFLGALFTLVLLIGIPVAFVAAMILGIHWNTGNGSQTGFVSATEQEGLIFKTNRVYIKPTLESTQEDSYCVTDDSVYQALRLAEIEKRPVSVKHHSFFIAGMVNCKQQAAIINAVQ